MKVTVNKTNIVVEDNESKIIINTIRAKEISYVKKESADKVARLGDLKPKDVFKIGEKEFIVLEHWIGFDEKSTYTKVISKNFVKDNMNFGVSSDWKQSPIRDFLNGEYYNKISKLVGEDNVCLMTRDLTSLDGLDDYGKCTDAVTLLTVNEYAKYHKTLGVNSKYSSWWWTITPWSAPSNINSCSIYCICPNGTLSLETSYARRGIRPVLTLNSNLKVRQVKEKIE